jgi:hypothetical protein
MTALVFVDSNVLIYAVDQSDAKKHEAAICGSRNYGRNAAGASVFRFCKSSTPTSLASGLLLEPRYKHRYGVS